MEIDLEAVRGDTPSCARAIHFNNAGASPMPAPVFNAVLRHLQAETEVGGYEAARRAAGDLDAFYAEFAGLLGCDPSEIAFVENATRAWDMAFYALPLVEGDRILTHDSEYVSNYLAFLQLAQRRGLGIDLIPSDPSGQIDVAAIPGLVTPRTRLIAITHVPTQGGLVNPAAEVGRVANEHGLLYLLDACQSAGQIDLDVAAIGCDVLTGTGRKFLRGPRGTGFLYMRGTLAGRLEPPFIDLLSAEWTGDDSYRLVPGARRFETWESNVAGRIGLMAAVHYARSLGLGAIERRVAGLAETLRHELESIPGVKVHDRGERRSGIVTFRKEGIGPSEVAAALRERNIHISTSWLSSARLDLGARGLDSLSRASVHYFNSEVEIARFTDAVRALP